MKPGKTGIGRLVDATRYSFQGIAACWKHEAAFRQEALLALILLPFSFFLAANPLQWLMLVTPLFVLLIVELLNSAVENIVDRVGDEHHELSGRAKDMGSAAVFFCLLLTGLTWLAIAWHNFF